MEELAARLRALSDEAFQEFATIFGPRFRGYFLRNGLPLSEAEDLAATCVTDIALKAGKYQSGPKSCFSAWVYTLARHELADRMGASHREVSFDALSKEVAMANQDQGASEPGMRPVALAVHEALATLTATDRAVVETRYFAEDLTFEQIGRKLALQPEAARVRHHRALKKLRSLLEHDPRVQELIGRK